MRLLGLIALALLAACAGPEAGGGSLTLANPQPDPAMLKPGLAVKYAYPTDVKSIADAKRHRQIARSGPPLSGFDYADTEEGENALTSRQPEKVVAFIDGYVRFDAPGAYGLKFWSNDGLEVKIGGAQVYLHDRRHTCQSKGMRNFNVPAAGWYRIDAVFFQRLNTSCLMANWRTPAGGDQSAPALAHLAE
jgi:hypothetical protein